MVLVSVWALMRCWGSLRDEAKHLLLPHRDKRAQAATVMGLGATFTACLNIPPGGHCYHEGMRYLYYTAYVGFWAGLRSCHVSDGLVCRPGGLINSAFQLMTGVDDYELLRMGVNTMHTLLMQLAEGSTVRLLRGLTWFGD